MSLFAPLTAPTSLMDKASSLDLNNANGISAAADPNALTPSFSDTLQNAFSKVNDMQNHAGEMTRAFATGQTSDIHSVMIAGEQATIALQMTAQIRNKVVDAYQEIMRMSM
jgi:flagellar hook-basal body complex protein FliE